MEEPCKRCLLFEAGETAAAAEVQAYLDTLPLTDLAEASLRLQRLKNCKTCAQLISGMCRKCGCYVEIRAALKDSHCPNADNQLW